MTKKRVIDLFSGAGGLSEGFRQAGFEIIGAVEFKTDPCNTFKKNFPNANVIEGDIKNVNLAELDFGKVDIIIGGFSSLNRHNKNLEDDPRNRLFEEFLRFVDYFEPQAILIENVRGILTSKDGYAKTTIENFFINRGYSVDSAILDASDFGVPQKRKRAFFVAFKNPICTNFKFERINEYKLNNKVKLVDVFSDLLKINESDVNSDTHEYPPNNNSDYAHYLTEGSDVISNHFIKYPSEIVRNRVKHVPQGGNWKNLDERDFP